MYSLCVIQGNLQVSMRVGQGHAMTATSSGRRVSVQSWSGSIHNFADGVLLGDSGYVKFVLAK